MGSKADKQSIWKRLHWGQLITFTILAAVVALFFIYYFTTPQEQRPGFQHLSTIYRDWRPRESFPLPGKIYYRSSDSTVVMAHDLWSNDEYEAVKVPGKVLGYSPEHRRLIYSDTANTYIMVDNEIKAQYNISYLAEDPVYAHPVKSNAFYIKAYCNYTKNRMFDTEGNLDTVTHVAGIRADNGDGAYFVRYWKKGRRVMKDGDTLLVLSTDDNIVSVETAFWGKDRVIMRKIQNPAPQKSVEILDLSGKVLETIPLNGSARVSFVDWFGNSGYWIVTEEEKIHFPFKDRMFYRQTLYRGAEKLVDYPMTQILYGPVRVFDGEDEDLILFHSYAEEKFYVSQGDAISPTFTIDKMYFIYGWAN